MVRYPQVGVGIFIFDPKGRILVGKRLSRIGRGYYSLPGGKVDWGETVRSAALREAFEETDLVIQDLEQIGYEDEIHPEYDMHFTCLYWAARTLHPELMFNTEPTKTEDWYWEYPDTVREAYTPVWPALHRFMSTDTFRQVAHKYR